MTNTAVRGMYSDFKIIRTRSVVQIIIEMPIEAGNNFIAMYGVPDPAQEKWVALALLNDPSPAAQQTEGGNWCIRTLSVLIEEEGFADFIYKGMGWPIVNKRPDTVLFAVRGYLGIRSRRDFRTNQDAVDLFKDLYSKYLEYQKEAVDNIDQIDDSESTISYSEKRE